MPVNEKQKVVHPCFGSQSRETVGRVHLPVAPRAWARVRFSPEKTLPPAMDPSSAAAWLDEVIDQGTPVKVVGITGPGDPLAIPELTVQAFNMVRQRRPEMILCLTTLGLGGHDWAMRLVELGLDHVTILIDAVEVEAAQKIYAWIRPGAKTLPLDQAAKLLIDEQARAIKAWKQAGLTVKVNTTVYPGINQDQVPLIAQRAAELGADVMRLVAFAPATEDCPRPPQEMAPGMMEKLNTLAAQYLPVMPLVEGCGQDLVGLAPPEAGLSPTGSLPAPSKQRPNLAVCSSDGFEVDLHLGQAPRFMIYGPNDGPVVLLGVRPAPEPGSGGSRWQEVALTLSDCFAVLASGAGETARAALSAKGLQVVVKEGNIEGLVDVFYGGGKKKSPGKGRG